MQGHHAKVPLEVHSEKGGNSQTIKIDRLWKIGFSLESFEDGKFWVYEKEAGEESEKALSHAVLAGL